jgi:hypothetical protein
VLNQRLVSWTPLLQGDDAAQIRAAVEAILEGLAARLTRDSSVFLANEGLGPALLFCYSNECSSNSPLRDLRTHLTKALHHVPEGLIHACLYGGLAGLGWQAAHIQRALELDVDEVVGEIDDALVEYLGQSPWTEPYDLISGLVGLGVYALERLPRPRARAALALILDRLAETVERRPEGVTWWSHPRWIGDTARASCPNGNYNLGLAHGVPGIIALLAGIIATGFEVARARPLLEGAVNWLLAQDPRDGQGFPFWLEARTNAPHRPRRLAWCYGDLGVAAALLCAAQATGEVFWEEEALRIAQRAARRPVEDCGIEDACICHGAGGLGHLFNRMYQMTADLELAEAARGWFAQAVALRQPGKGVAGFRAWDIGPDGQPGWVESAGFLTGATGIGLALLAAVSSVEPTWDRVLLISLPPSGPPSPAEARGQP